MRLTAKRRKDTLAGKRGGENTNGTKKAYCLTVCGGWEKPAIYRSKREEDCQKKPGKGKNRIGNTKE